MTDRMNVSCTACRLAKVKCVYDEDSQRCKRCTRNGIECLQEKRRSKWDSVQKRAKVPSTPALVAPSAPAKYGELISALTSLTSAPGCSSCFRHTIKERLGELIELTIAQNDAATLAWAMGQVAAQGFSLDAFPHFRRGVEGPPASKGPLEDCSPLLSLPPEISKLFVGPLPCLLSVSDTDQPKRYLVNAHCNMSVANIDAAQSPEALYAALNAHPSDAKRIFIDAGPAWTQKKEEACARARGAPVDADPADADIAKFGPYLLRMRLSDEASADGRWELYTMYAAGCATHRGERYVMAITFCRVRRRSTAKRQKTELATSSGASTSTSPSQSPSHNTQYLSEDALRGLVEDLHGFEQADGLLDEFMMAMSDDFAPGE